MSAESPGPEFAQLDAYITEQLAQARAALNARTDTPARLTAVLTAARTATDHDGTAAASDKR